MPRTNGHATRKPPASATPPRRTPSRRRAAPSAAVPPTPPLPEDLPEHATLLPAPPEAPYSLPAPPGANEPGDVPRFEASPVALSPALIAQLTAVWPDLQAIAYWWQERQRLAQQDETPDRKLTRQTYHVEQRYIDAVKREADRTGESHAAVVNQEIPQSLLRGYLVKGRA
jgi:hypothetical protein